MTVAAVGLVVLGLTVAAVAAEVAVASIVRRRTGEALATSLGGSVDVRVRDRPLLLALARRHLRRVSIVARRVPIGATGGRISRLDVELEGVDLPRGRGGDPDHRPLRAAAGRFVAHLSPDDVAAIIDPPPGVRGLELTRDGLRIRTLTGVAFTTSLLARDGDLVIRADRGILAVLPRAEFVIPLHDLPAGAAVEDAAVRDREVVARGRLDGARLPG